MRSDYEIRPASNEEIKSFYNGIRVREIQEAFGLFRENQCIAVSGTLVDPSHFGTIFENEGRIIGFLDTREKISDIAIHVVRMMRRHLLALGREVYVQCDVERHPQAPRLMTLLGFVPTGEMQTNMETRRPIEVWKWQP